MPQGCSRIIVKAAVAAQVAPAVAVAACTDTAAIRYPMPKGPGTAFNINVHCIGFCFDEILFHALCIQSS